MLYDFTTLDVRNRYKLLCATVAPRPIAWVSTMDAQGVLNAAPFSFFNVVCESPALLMFSIGHRAPGDGKDTGANIRATGEFVVNLVTDGTLDAMNTTAADFAPHEDEFAYAGLTPAPSVQIRPPRIQEARVAFECRLYQLLEIHAERTVVLGEVVAMHVDDGVVLDADRCHIDMAALGLIGRLGGNTYSRTHDLFDLPRPSMAEIKGTAAGG